MPGRIASTAALAAAVASVLVAGCGGGKHAGPGGEPPPGEPSVHIVSPRNGERQAAHAVVVTVAIRNFHLAPGQMGREPLLGEGYIRFKLDRIPNCVPPEVLKRASQGPLGNGRVGGVSVDYPRYSGPNGVLAERIGSAGSYSPATRPAIFYHELPPGFYRLIVILAQNNGAMTPFHAVANFQVLPNPGQRQKPCRPGEVPSLGAAANVLE
jgi:hypothetical protein